MIITQSINPMFENEKQKSGRISNVSKNNSSSRPKLTKKQPLQKPKIAIDIIKTDNPSFKQKKSTSQCLPKNHRKSIDVQKYMQTTRSNGNKKSREKTQIKPSFQQIYTQGRVKHESYQLSNLTTQKSAELKWNKKGSVRRSQGRSAQRKKMIWNDKVIPYDWHYVVENYGHYLTKYQLSEIKEYKKIYYIGHRVVNKNRGREGGFDNEDKEYIHIQNDHLAYRYQLMSSIGNGSYGQVFRGYDHKQKQQIAIKIIKNQAKFSKQAFIQIKILSNIKQIDSQQSSNIIKIKDFVIFRKHVCIIFQLLSDNLYQLIIRNNYNGLSEQLIRRFAIQLLISLQFLQKNHIIHCDLKPENILLKQYNKSGIKIIDFGSSCFKNQRIYTYIQSRYYRAPEITIGMEYSHGIDIWSIGCILGELYSGVPVFPGQNQYEQMKYMIDTLGMPRREILAKGIRRGVFFQEGEERCLREEVKGIKTGLQMFSKPLRDRIQDKDFLEFIQGFLRWDPEERISPLQALGHHWIKKGLPEELRSKLSASNKMLKKSSGGREVKEVMESKERSKEKGSSVKKKTRGSQQRLKKSYGLKY